MRARHAHHCYSVDTMAGRLKKLYSNLPGPRSGCRHVTFLDDITVLILTYNEAPNIGRTLSALTRFPFVCRAG